MPLPRQMSFNRVLLGCMSLFLWGVGSLTGSLLLSADEAAPEAVQSMSFQLPSVTDGAAISIEPDKASVTVICFLGTDCPLVKLYAPRLSGMANEFKDRQVRFFGVNSNRQDTLDDMKGFLTESELSFPLVRDEANVVADMFGAARTPEVFVLNRSLQVVYRGRIDDQYAPGINRPLVTRHDLREAITDVLAGRPVSVASTEPVGCMIGKIRRPVNGSSSTPAEAVTYSNQVSRVLQKHCIECHRSGDIGPFSLESYEEAVGWADTMLEVIDNGRMPPWHADPNHRAFANARSMPKEDKDLIRRWVETGAAEGDKSQLPAPQTYSTGWQLGRKPDLELPMRDRPYTIPAEGTVEYQYFVVDPQLTEEKWVTAAQVIPGNRSVVHHAIVFIRPPDDQPFRGVGWLTAYVPGQRMIPMPAGHARRVPAGSKFVFQMHYTTNGSVQEDLSTVGLTFTDRGTVTDEVITLIGLDQEFEIPPHAAQHPVSGKVRWMPKNGKLLAIAPHMHVRGKSFELRSETGGREETLLNVPLYDFNWQHSYILSEPLRLSDIDNLNFTATFDNSSENPFNPNPAEWVNWGDQTWEEMAVVFLEVSDPLVPKDDSSESSAVASASIPDANKTSETEAKIQAFVDEFFARLDKNGDGVVLRSEAPIAVRGKFSHYDHNGDNQVRPDEIRQLAEARFSK